MIKRIPYEDYKKTWNSSEERRQKLRRLWRAGKNFLEMLRSAEGRWS